MAHLEQRLVNKDTNARYGLGRPEQIITKTREIAIRQRATLCAADKIRRQF